MALYSMQNIAETLEKQSEILAPGVKGINFMKPEIPVNTHSAVFQAILEEEAKVKGTRCLSRLRSLRTIVIPNRRRLKPIVKTYCYVALRIQVTRLSK